MQRTGKSQTHYDTNPNPQPITQPNPPLEALTLLVDSLESKISGLSPQLDGVQVSPLLWAHGLQDLELDGQAMTVPARHIARPLALQQLELEDEVLEHLVQGVTWRAVSSDKCEAKRQ